MLKDEHKQKLNDLINEIALDMITEIEGSNKTEANVKLLMYKLQEYIYELQDYLGDFSINDAGILYSDGLFLSYKQFIENSKKERVKVKIEKDPWNLGED